MEKQTFDDFKIEIRNWLENHPNEYDEFVNIMNRESLLGIQCIYILGKKFSPRLMKKAKKTFHNDINYPKEEEFLSFNADEDLAAQLVKQFRKATQKTYFYDFFPLRYKVFPFYVATDEITFKLLDLFPNRDLSSIVPCFFSWLYYGKCFETMVEKLEDEIKKPKTKYVYKLTCKILIKFVISGSIRNKMRTKADWEEYRKNRSLMKEGMLVDDIINVIHFKPDEENVPIVEYDDKKQIGTEIVEVSFDHTEKAEGDEAKISSNENNPETEERLETYLTCEDDAQQIISNIEIILKNELLRKRKITATFEVYIFAGLDELDYFVKKIKKESDTPTVLCNPTVFHKILKNLFPAIVKTTERNMQKSFYKIYTKKMTKNVRPNSFERQNIDEIKDLLRIDQDKNNCSTQSS